MPAFTGDLIPIYLTVFLTWLIIVLGVAQISRLYYHVKLMHREIDTNLTGMAQILQKTQSIQAELLKENRRMSRLLADLGDLKRAEMTGSFEIVEEPVVQPEKED